mmetsp:Transcript_5468/g.10237  ORF Transcript_5468/g.10237 Transcript_5468/m.10237 type:complete len:90 (-) Transcript_5468:8-277(-)
MFGYLSLLFGIYIVAMNTIMIYRCDEDDVPRQDVIFCRTVSTTAKDSESWISLRLQTPAYHGDSFNTNSDHLPRCRCLPNTLVLFEYLS